MQSCFAAAAVFSSVKVGGSESSLLPGQRAARQAKAIWDRRPACVPASGTIFPPVSNRMEKPAGRVGESGYNSLFINHITKKIEY